MNVLAFVLVPVVLVGAYATYLWLRNRQPTSVESGVDAFRREMSALSPDAAPIQRRPARDEPHDTDQGQEPPGRTSPRPPGAREDRDPEVDG